MNSGGYKPLVRCYAALLHLYPAGFRREFGREMLDVYCDLLLDRGPLLASIFVLGELFPTLLREHLDDPSSLALFIRGILCPLPVLIVYAALLGRVQRVEEFALSTFWLLCILAAFWKTGCRGRICLLRTMAASVVGILFPLAFINTYEPMSPGLLSLAAPFALLAMTVGLILAALARVIMEGIKLRAAA